MLLVVFSSWFTSKCSCCWLCSVVGSLVSAMLLLCHSGSLVFMLLSVISSWFTSKCSCCCLCSVVGSLVSAHVAVCVQ